jgi:hypothetical protein
MILKCYIVVLLTTAIDEQWNINNPRPEPKKTYNCLQWEKADFFTYKINNEWVLRPYRKTDTKLKKKVRKKYWAKRAKLKK